ncbi:hypothetical protein [Methanospirillum lacunae]|uniref:hypothetical protein n=1 Tax=Methanospirillum lacunae TaxID=668570 RepID=UPI0011B207EA|nr:hypothetical protein [Methanospirillum lacunae]
MGNRADMAKYNGCFHNFNKKYQLGNVAVNTDFEYFRVFADPFLDGLIYNLIDKYLIYGQNVILISSYWFKKEILKFGLLRIME